MAHTVVLITPTHRIGYDGYYEAKLQMAKSTPNGYEKIGKPWIADSVHFYGNLNMDFENKGNIVVWNDDDNLVVRESYGTKIFATQKDYNNYYNR